MDSLDINDFDGNQINTYNFEGKVCYIGLDIAKLFGYANPSKAIQRCIQAKDLKLGQDYDVLTGERLRKFKRILFSEADIKMTHTPKIILLYKTAIYSFIFYSEKEIAIPFQEWFRENIDSVDYNENFIENEIKKEILESESKVKESKREEYLDLLNDVLEVVEHIFLLDLGYEETRKPISKLLNISKYLIDRMQD
ncbi:MAG: BRO family protein [Sarcina sp.]